MPEKIIKPTILKSVKTEMISDADGIKVITTIVANDGPGITQEIVAAAAMKSAEALRVLIG